MTVMVMIMSILTSLSSLLPAAFYSYIPHFPSPCLLLLTLPYAHYTLIATTSPSSDSMRLTSTESNETVSLDSVTGEKTQGRKGRRYQLLKHMWNDTAMREAWTYHGRSIIFVLVFVCSSM